MNKFYLCVCYLLLLAIIARFDAELLRDVIHGLKPPAERLSRKKFHFQLASEADSDELSGTFKLIRARNVNILQ